MKKSIMEKLFSKKEECTHHWHYVGKTTVHTDLGCDVATDKMNALFCPKCEAEMTVSDERWEQLQAIQKVRESYQCDSPVEEVAPAVTAVTTKMPRKRSVANI